MTKGARKHSTGQKPRASADDASGGVGRQPHFVKNFTRNQIMSIGCVFRSQPTALFSKQGTNRRCPQRCRSLLRWPNCLCDLGVPLPNACPRDAEAWLNQCGGCPLTTCVPAMRSWMQRRSSRKIKQMFTIEKRGPRIGMAPMMPGTKPRSKMAFTPPGRSPFGHVTIRMPKRRFPID
jgi:hypothetical protein